MPDLLLVRHGAAEALHPDGDAARRLTADGVAGVRAAAAALAARTRPAHILTSPYTRAVETAALLAEATGAPIELCPEMRASQASAAAVAAIAGQVEPGTVLVGHNPTLTEAAALLLGRPEGLVRFRPGTVAALDRDQDGINWTLAWVISPGGTFAKEF